MTPFHKLTQTICNFKVLQRMLIRVFPVLLCWFSPFALADAVADIESLIQNKQWTQAERLIQAEIDRKKCLNARPPLQFTSV